MSIQNERLSSLIEFCHQSARLRGRPVSNIASHGVFALFENDLREMPGVYLNINGTNDEDEIWLSVDRLHETRPPEIHNAVILPWIRIGRGPNEPPTLKNSISGDALITAGTHFAIDSTANGPKVDSKSLIQLEEFGGASQVKVLFDEYVKSKWTPWSNEEKKRIKTISLYAHLFTLKQQLEGSIVEAQLELVWGVGIGVWKTEADSINYPIISQLVEISLNPISAALEVRPRDVEPRLEMDWYVAQDNLGVTDLEKESKKFFETLPVTFSPFDVGTFEPLLRIAVTNLDANGIYWPLHTQPEDRSIPISENKLKITDTWALFARPRTNNFYLQDLERLRKAAEEMNAFPPAITTIITDPETTNTEVALPGFRGISAAYHSGSMQESSTSNSGKAHDLYFPKPFNDEQVKIIQLLEVHNGVVVQGPPGTGKTHTIANVICHFLANGKRVLVTSMKDPALGVLQDKLPEEIKPLAVSLLTSEREGLKKFEHSISKIASEVQSLDRSATAREIRHLEESIDMQHGQLVRIDREIASWAKKNLTKIVIASVEIGAQEAAQELISNYEEPYQKIPDDITITDAFEPKFNDSDINDLRDARRDLADDILYLNAKLPQLIEFPDSKSILQTHQDLSRFEQLQKEVSIGNVPSLVDTDQTTIDAAAVLQSHVDQLKKLRVELQALNADWISKLRQHLLNETKQEIVSLLITLGEEIVEAQKQRKEFFEKPVLIPEEMESNRNFYEAIVNLSEGRLPFGIKGFLSKSAEKKTLDSIQIMGASPANTDDWKHVSSYLKLLIHFRELSVRWNAIAQEISLPTVSTSSTGGLQTYDYFLTFQKIQEEFRLESMIQSEAKRLFSSWSDVNNVITDKKIFSELDRALHHHLTKNRLANVWIQKEALQKLLDGRDGLVINHIREFLSQTFGNPLIEDRDMQSSWSGLMSELSRVLGLRSKLDIVQRVTDLIRVSGAPEYARILCEPLKTASDEFLPSNWRQCWKLRRLSTYIKEIDAQEALKDLSKRRHNVEADLAKAYKDTVVKRTWLKLAENASPSIRAALQGYLSAIQKIGKGTGKRAVRYRQDARNAASTANAAVPCWIMPHYRVSESLPPEIGCFDLVIIDEASQSDLTALPAILRAKKVLIVGDDKQVSPEGVGLEEEKILNLMNRFLGSQVETYRPQMSPERSIYDLFKVVFAKSSVMLKEHFRCVGPIIEYSKREFYNHELRPLRLPKSSERLDPPLIDIWLKDGYRQGDKNQAEARFIVDEIKRITSDEKFADRSIGVVSLLADKQAYLIWEMLTEELGPELLQRHEIACGDARTFQGKERDVLFLSMVVAPNEPRISALSRDTYAQRFNVAASRARDRMYLVRSVALEDLSPADKLRRSLISHFSSPFVQDEERVSDLKKLCESPFEREVYDQLVQRGYWVTPQVKVGQFRIDLVVEGNNDLRLAIECDGDRYHGPDKWADDMQRQRILERAGWSFWRCFASTWVMRRKEMVEDLVRTLSEYGIEPVGSNIAPRSVHTEQRIISATDLEKAKNEHEATNYSKLNFREENSKLVSERNQDVLEPSIETSTRFVSVSSSKTSENSSSQTVMISGLTITKYQHFSDNLDADPRNVNEVVISDGLVKIIKVEGPMLAKRACDIYLRSVGINRMGHQIRSKMINALNIAISSCKLTHLFEAEESDLLCSIVRISQTPELVIRTRGDRLFEEIPPSEIQFIARYLQMRKDLIKGTDDHLRAVLEFLDLKRLTTQVSTSILAILDTQYPYVDLELDRIEIKG